MTTERDAVTLPRYKENMRRTLLILLLLHFFGINLMSQATSCEDDLPLSVPTEKSKQNAKDAIDVYYINGVLYISNAYDGAKIEVKNVLGARVLVATMKSKDGRIVVSLKRGVYIVGVGSHLQRIVVR